MSQIAHAHPIQSTTPALAELDRIIYGVYRLRSFQAAAPNTAELRNISAEHEPLENDIRQRWFMVLNAARDELELINRKNPGRISPADFEPLLDRFSDQFRYMFNHSFGPRDESKTMFFEGVRGDINELVKLKVKANSIVLAESELNNAECHSPVNPAAELLEEKKPKDEGLADKPLESQKKQKPDGPDGGVLYRYQGKVVKLKRTSYRVVMHMENREHMTFEELNRLVNEYFEIDDDTFHTWAHRANEEMRPLNVPWEYTADKVNRIFRKEFLPQNNQD